MYKVTTKFGEVKYFLNWMEAVAYQQLTGGILS